MSLDFGVPPTKNICGHKVNRHSHFGTNFNLEIMILID